MWLGVLKFSWPMAEGLKKRAGSTEEDIGLKYMPRDPGGLPTVGDPGWKGVGGAYPAVWLGVKSGGGLQAGGKG